MSQIQKTINEENLEDKKSKEKESRSETQDGKSLADSKIEGFVASDSRRSSRD